MDPHLLQALGVALLGAAAALDRVTPSLLLSQPLWCGALCGAILGRFEAGVAAGAIAQCLGVGVLPVGGARLPDAAAAGIAAAAAAPPDLALAGGAWLHDARLAPAAGIGVLAAWLGRAALRAQENLHTRWASGVEAGLARGDLAAVERLHRRSLAVHALRGAVLAVALVELAPHAARLAARAGVAAPAGSLALVLAAAGLAAGARTRRQILLAAAGGIAAVGFVAWSAP